MKMNATKKMLLSEMGLTLPPSVLHQASRKKLLKTVKVNEYETLKVSVRYDDSCKNGHNSFAITADLFDKSVKRDGGLVMCGCLHDDITKHCPELTHLIKWHHTSTDGPLYYLENGCYRAKQVASISASSQFFEETLNSFRKTVVWPEATMQDAIDASICYGAIKLVERLPVLMDEFKQVIESLGFEY